MKKIILFLSLSLSSLVSKEIAMVKSLQGIAEVKREKNTLLLKIGEKINEGDLIITKSKSSIGIIFDDGTRLSLGSKSVIRIKNFLVDPANNKYNVDLNMTQGKASFSSGKIGKLSPESVKFYIPEGVIGIRGTKFLVDINN